MGRTTQTELGEAVGVKQGAVSKWLRGESLPGIEKVPAIESKLGLPSGTLMAIRTGDLGPSPSQEIKQALTAVRRMRSELDLIERALLARLPDKRGS